MEKSKVLKNRVSELIKKNKTGSFDAFDNTPFDVSVTSNNGGVQAPFEDSAPLETVELNKKDKVLKTGIKSKHRVDNFGEVYTPENIVNDMLDLVKDESYRLDATFLEPACGNGNFLVEILRRKLETARVNAETSEGLDFSLYNKNIFIAVSSVYGIDILEDNVEEAKTRMLELVEEVYERVTGEKIASKLLSLLKKVININIICGDALTGDRKGEGVYGVIRISEWFLNSNNEVCKKDYKFIDGCLSPISNEIEDFKYCFNEEVEQNG